MHDILELPEVRGRVSRMSVSAYHQLCELRADLLRTELVRGIVIEKMSKSPLHASILTVLSKAVLSLVPHGFTLRTDNPLTLADSEPEPDLALVRGTDRDFFKAHPITAELVVEVAVTSLSLDRENASLYAEAGVKEYWIVLAEKQQVEVYRQPQDGRYTVVRNYTRGETLACESVPQIRVTLAEIFPD